jgi:hypothetical protein
MASRPKHRVSHTAPGVWDGLIPIEHALAVSARARGRNATLTVTKQGLTALSSLLSETPVTEAHRWVAKIMVDVLIGSIEREQAEEYERPPDVEARDVSFSPN